MKLRLKQMPTTDELKIIGVYGEWAQKEVLEILSGAEMTPESVDKDGWYRIGGWWFPAGWFEVIKEE